MGTIRCDLYSFLSRQSLLFAQGAPCLGVHLFGLAISFKLQAIFFLPVLLILLLRRKLPLKYLILIPAVFLLALAPAFLVTRDA